jgi:hypothetical protein
MTAVGLRSMGAPVVRPLVVVGDTEHSVLVQPVPGWLGSAHYSVSL